MAIINLTNAAANAAIMSVINDIDADGTEGTLKVYTTPMPASPDAAATGTLLSEHTLTYPCLVKQTLTGTPSWAGGSATFTDTGHSVLVDDRIVVVDTTSNLYDGEYTVATVPDANTFTVVMADPGGSPATAGTYTAVSVAVATFDAITDDSSANANGTAFWARIADNSGDAVVDVDAGEATESLVFNTAVIEISTNVAIDSFTLSV